MADETNLVYEFGSFCLNPVRRVLLRAGDPVPLTPKAFETLLALVRRSGRVVVKEELLEEVWPDTFVEEATLAQNVFTLRKALGHGQSGQQYIETIPKYGYRFVAEVTVRREERTEFVLERHSRTQIITETTEDDAPVVREGTSSRRKSDGQGGDASRQDSQVSPAMRRETVESAGAAAQSGNFQAPRRRRLLKVSLVAAALLLTLAAVASLSFRRWSRRAGGPVYSFHNMRISRLSSNGKTVRAAISADGMYVASVLRDGRAESLWLRQVSASNAVQIVAPADSRYLGVTFSPDGGAVYYVMRREGDAAASLYQVPALGGTPRETLADVDSPIGFSPDGKRIAFVRNDPNRMESSLVVAGFDGAGERKLATRSRPDFFSTEGPAWSPDGQSIACAVGKGEFNNVSMTVAEVRVDDAAEKIIGPRRWDLIGQIAWPSGGDGILMSAWDSTVSLLSGQIWSLSYPDGEARRITNDMNSYHGVSATASGDALLTIQAGRTAQFWIAPAERISDARQITSGTGDLIGEALGVAWTPDGRMVYGSTAGGGIDVWVMQADGSGQRQLTVDPQPDLKPSVSPDGRFIVFVSWRSGKTHLWRMDADGTNPRQLTDGNGETYPSVSPDGQWVFYSAVDNHNQPSLWKVPTAGGQARPLNFTRAVYPSASPDGKLVAFFYLDRSSDNTKIMVVPAEGGEPVKSFDQPPTVSVQAGIHWDADGKTLTYVDTRGGVSNIWSQPLAGGQPVKLTDFSSDKIFRFAWSRDGKHLAFERGVEIRDLTLISNSK